MTFTHDWFSGNIPVWTHFLKELKDKPCKALEVGCFEGRATCWLLENILTHPASSITCIDTFKGSVEHGELGIDFSGVRDRFLSNTGPLSWKVNLIESRSVTALPCLPRRKFQFVYVDGSHAATDTLMDICMAWPLLDVNGIMAMDDYEWPTPDLSPDLSRPKMAIDAFLGSFIGRLRLLHKGYQVIVKKTTT